MDKFRYTAILVLAILLAYLLTACHHQENHQEKMDNFENTYLALGDSYTIGESVGPGERWPVRLAENLNARGCRMADPEIIAQTGWTTGELLNAIGIQDIKNDYGLVSLLIGVNDQFRGLDSTGFRERFIQLLDSAIVYAGGLKERVFVLSIPDYGVTPFGQERDPERIAEEIDQFNAIKERVCRENDVIFIDITDISRRAENEPILIATDSLHPSAKMYSEWVDRALPVVKEMICN